MELNMEYNEYCSLDFEHREEKKFLERKYFETFSKEYPMIGYNYFRSAIFTLTDEYFPEIYALGRILHISENISRLRNISAIKTFSNQIQEGDFSPHLKVSTQFEPCEDPIMDASYKQEVQRSIRFIETILDGIHFRTILDNYFAANDLIDQYNEGIYRDIDTNIELYMRYLRGIQQNGVMK